jgi:hypothetical protein
MTRDRVVHPIGNGMAVAWDAVVESTPERAAELDAVLAQLRQQVQTVRDELLRGTETGARLGVE